MEHLTPPTFHPSGSQQVHPQNWDLKVSTNLQTRLLLVQDPQSTIRSLQDAIEEDHLAIYPAQGPVKCSTVCAVDYNAAGAERYYPINSKYLLRDALKRDGAEVFAYVELKQKKRKRSLGSHTTPDLLSGAPSQKRPRAAAAASSPSPLPHAQLEGEVRSGSSDLTGGVEGDTETGMTRKAARAKQRKKKLKGKQRAAATDQKAVKHGEKETGGSQIIQHSLQPQKDAAETGATEYNEGCRQLHEGEGKPGASGAVAAAVVTKAAKPMKTRELFEEEGKALAGKSGKRKRGRSQAGAAEAEGAGARQVPQGADEDLAEGTGAASRQLRQAADAAEPAEARSPEQGRRKRWRNDRHGSGADSLFLESSGDRDALLRPRERAPQPSSAPVAAAAATPGKEGLTAMVVDRNILHELELEGRRRTLAGLRSSGAHGRPAAKDISHFSPAAAEGNGGEGGTASGMADGGRAEVTTNNAAEPAPLPSKRSSSGGLRAAAGTAKKDDSESSSEEDGGGPSKATTAPGQTVATASGAPDQVAGTASSQSSDSTSESESDSDDEEAPAQHTRSQQPRRRAAQCLHLDSSFSGAADSPNERGPVQTSAPAAQKCSQGAEPRPMAASGDAAEKLALPPAEPPQSSSSSQDDSSDESSDSDNEGRPQGGNAAGAPKQEAPKQVLPKQDALDESSYGGESEPGFKEESSYGGESDPRFKEEADVKEDEEPEEVKSVSEEEGGVKREGCPGGQAEASSADESSRGDDPSEEEDSEGEEQDSEEEQWGDEESAGSDGMGSPEGETDGASPTAAEGEGGTSRNMALEDTDFDRLKNEATQKVLDTLADMPDAISMLLAAKSARKKARQNGGAAAAAGPAQQEAPSTPVPSDARLALLGEALIRQKESQEQATQNNAAAVTLPGHPELKPLAEYKGESDLRSALRAALVSLVNHQQGTNHKFAVQVLRECPKPAWWPLERWDKNQLDRRWKALETIYHAIQKQRRSLMGSASCA